MKKILTLTLAVVMMACGNTKKSDSNDVNNITIDGAGATFPLPYYNLAFKKYQENMGNTVTYGGIGSGGGIRSLKDQIVDFGGSDAFLSDKELAEMPAEVIHIPTCMGAVVMGYNLPQVTDLKLTGEIIADIYLGKITKWNDARIQAINTTAQLPNSTINVVYRSDGSGTTFIFSDYLTKVSPLWASEVGTGKSLKWPVGIAAKGNPGVAGTISQTAGSIGYIGSEYAFSLKIPTTLIQNIAGNFIEPNAASISAAANFDMPADTRTMITNSPAPDAYPISCFTWVLIYKEQNYRNRTSDQALALVNLMNWMLESDAQALTTAVHYSSLPSSTVENAKALLRTVTYNGTPIMK